ncbi:MAG: hypothetical protein MUF24_06765 [Chitinophagaceae bacterium]|jgi:hypothetical protein|nr:hypothetical protein [Chitinophagaceae bacterium]
MSISVSFSSKSILLLLAVFVLQQAKASKGGGDDKNKKGVVLKVNGFEVKKTYMTPLSLMNSGATYKGTFSPMQTRPGGTSSSLITYEKGNTIFIYPVQQNTLLHKFKAPNKADIKY